MRTFNLFLSHSWTYGDAYDRLKALLRKRPYFAFKDYSVPKDDPVHTNGSDSELYTEIKQQIQPVHVVVILAGVYASYSRWIQTEIQIAKDGFSIPKPILAVEPRGAEKTSAVVKSSADKIVRWNTESIVRGIRDLAP